MPLPEGYLPRKGDEVLIRVRAVCDLRPDDDAGGCLFVVVGAEHQNIFLSRDQIHSLYCRKWNEGDRVRVIGEPETVGEVVAARGKYVWIEVDKVDWSMCTFEANELEAEPEEIAVETLTEAELLAGLEGLTT